MSCNVLSYFIQNEDNNDKNDSDSDYGDWGGADNWEGNDSWTAVESKASKKVSRMVEFYYC